MRNLHYVSLLSLALVLGSCEQKSSKDVENSSAAAVQKDASGYEYETVENDPTGLRLYTLKNGLKVYLSKNSDEPKIQTYIAVKAGSNYDPKDNTGLAHYLEHMVFKGTDEIGTKDWETEKGYLKQISDLYEKHAAEKDEAKKEAIYREIDSVSNIASTYAIANEYDKMTSSIGAEGTNAHTWVEETVYKNKIPANELEKWASLESERFSQLVLRLFHTELEAVYEEFNRGQDNDGRKMWAAMLDGLFPNHPYGQQNTIGTSEHLKSPSLEAIHAYFDKYYVPNNMSVVLVGDLDFDATIKTVDKYFGGFKHKDVTHPTLPTEQPITKTVVKEVFGPTAETVNIAYRAEGIGSKEEKMVKMVDMILANSAAGLIDLNLNQKQELQYGTSYTQSLNDYGFHVLNGMPKGGQSLEEVKDLLLSQIELVKQGKFDDWLLEAVINDMELSDKRSYENSTAVASAYYNAFIHNQDWSDVVNFNNELRSITKKDIVDFANKFYKDNNQVIVYKRKGEDKNIVKVKNPGITPVEVNRNDKSPFLAKFENTKSPDLKPKFVDYKSEIKSQKLENGIEISYVENKTNDLFDLNIIFDMGRDNNKKLAHAVGFIDYLGTDKISAEDIKKEFYKLGIKYGVQVGNERSVIYISGLQKNMDKGLELLENLMANVTSDKEAYAKYVDRIMKGRQDTKMNKGAILWGGLQNYAKYGEDSRFRNILSYNEMMSIDPQELVDMVKELNGYKQRMFYYGNDLASTTKAIQLHHKVAGELKDYPVAKEYQEQSTKAEVLFAEYDMVQAELLFLAKDKKFDKKSMAVAKLFNTYFGSGLSSIVFQEIRESKSLAYSAFSSYSQARKADESNYVMAYIGTQANKLNEAVDAMMHLMNNIPTAESQFNAAKNATLKKIAAERITKDDIFWNYERIQKLGFEHDFRKEMYEEVQKLTVEDLVEFFNENIKGKNFTTLVVGNKEAVDMEALSKLGTIKEMDIDELFNYEKSEIKQ
ncbi:M16 family metallopeptidase [Aureivirga sp. CE67]|uniref:M16 family metallopeptidase n=1 Tax=Aureivirga sp. CE67 TaxID=1788983 RepID=UPI0018C9C1E4|nr:M16 family metallopeptidase [Aureivirga sp. CE67]